MDKTRLETLLRNVEGGTVSVDAAMEQLKDLPFEDLGFARFDTHRSLRKGFGEVIFAPGKTVPQMEVLVERSIAHHDAAFVTRLGPDEAARLVAHTPALEYDEVARIAHYRGSRSPTPDIAEGYYVVITAGTADIPVGREAMRTLEFLGKEVRFLADRGVAGLHRLLDTVDELRGARAVIVVAGMEGALASVVAGMIDRPVVAVPTSIGYGASFGGIAPLLTMLNSCATGVAVVNIDNGFGAACFAAAI